MVSLRRRRLLGLCSGSSSFVNPLPLYCENLTGSENLSWHAKPKSEQPMLSDDASIPDSNTVVQEEPGPAVKRRKRHRRKNLHSQEVSMRGVYFKNMKWQAAIKVDKKQIHLGTVGSQEEAAHLYDRAAFMCGREPNFDLPEEEKQELRKFKWDDFLAMTRQAITRKKLKRMISPELPNSFDWESKQGVSGFSPYEDADQETSMS
ncbi:ethylene-responsive transcription factor-like protein At4g13040 isoform X6 [Medicago truncatula]|uniref:ethylene-responsive transcription factor-like protein At4g13040 isoform X6 n=1 Tax=Medicago truncatula TaxID=3880 RepID=UPI0019681439|nr:ethylene-responsive transcription factor-like protein At4g13040 isoform X6 [Medicago truncatula]